MSEEQKEVNSTTIVTSVVNDVEKTEVKTDKSDVNETKDEHFGELDHPTAEEPTDVVVDSPEKTDDEAPAPLPKTIKESKEVKEAYDKILTECKEIYDKKVKEEGFDPSTIEYEDEEHLIPKITEEDIKIFNAVSDNMFADMGVETYIDMAKEDIENYKALKANMDSGILDSEDADYFKMSSQSKDESRILLTVIQLECRKVAKEFAESHVAEDTIRSVVYDDLSNYIINKFKLNKSWIDPKAKDNSEEIVEYIKNYMFVAPMFYYEAEREYYKSHAENKYNLFNVNKFNSTLQTIVYAINNYLNNSKTEKEALSIGKILDKDFKVMNFTKPIIAYSIVKYNKELLTTELKDDADNKILANANILAPSPECEKNMDFLCGIIRNSITLVEENIGTIAKIVSDFKDNVIKDPLFKKLPENINLDDFYGTCKEISNLIPDIQKSSVVQWGVSYSFIQKYIFWHTLNSFLTTYQAAATDNNKSLDTIIFVDFLSHIYEHMFTAMYADIITDLNDNVKDYGKTTKSTMFATIINNILLQHEFGFKSKVDDLSCMYNEDKTVNKDKLYEMAKTIFGDRNSFMVNDKHEEDLLLKDVDLLHVKNFYISATKQMVNAIFNELQLMIDLKKVTK